MFRLSPTPPHARLDLKAGPVARRCPSASSMPRAATTTRDEWPRARYWSKLDAVNASEIEIDALLHVERFLVALARAFVTSDEVNDKFDEARRTIDGREFDDLASLVAAIDAAGCPFEFRALNIKGIDNEKVRQNLLPMLQASLSRPARMLALDPKLRVAGAPALAGLEDGQSTAEVTCLEQENPSELEQLRAEADALTTQSIFELPPSSGWPLVSTVRDPVPAFGDLGEARAHIAALLDQAERRFNELVEQRRDAIRRKDDLAARFSRAMGTLRDCIESIEYPKPDAASVACEVFDGILAGFSAVDPLMPKLPGAVGAAEILGAVVLELLGLRPTPADAHDTTRHEYMSKARNRAKDAASRGA